MDDREFLQEKLREVVVLLGDLNEVDKTVSRLRSELRQEYINIDQRLDNENLENGKDNENPSAS